jgi:hypothetical protein
MVGANDARRHIRAQGEEDGARHEPRELRHAS